MSAYESSADRREFLKNASAVGTALGLAGKAFGRPSIRLVLGANDRINIGVIGVGDAVSTSRGSLPRRARKRRADYRCLTWCQKRKKRAAEAYKAQGYLDYKRDPNRDDIDAVVVATPDHWHAIHRFESDRRVPVIRCCYTTASMSSRFRISL